MKTALYELLATKLGKDPVADIRERREAGTTWRDLVDHYRFDVGVSVTDVTLRTWVTDAEVEAKTAG